MNITINVPEKKLYKVSDKKHFICSANEVLNNLDYEKFFAKQSSDGYKVILNNRSKKEDEEISDDDIVRACYMVRPQIMILPDARDNYDKTITKTLDFFAKSLESVHFSTELMSVVQGEDRESWLSCFRMISEMPEISFIGIASTKVLSDNGEEMSRVEFLKLIEDLNIVPYYKRFYFLGLGNTTFTDLRSLNKLNNVEGIAISLRSSRKLQAEVMREIKYLKV